jgi:hypothetical protein
MISFHYKYQKESTAKLPPSGIIPDGGSFAVDFFLIFIEK